MYNLTTEELNKIKGDAATVSDADLLLAYAQFNYIRNSPSNPEYLFNPDEANYYIDNVIMPEFTKRGIDSSRFTEFDDVVKAQALTANLQIAANKSFTNYLAIKNARLAKNKKIWMWVIIIAVVLVAGWAWMKYKK